MDGRTAVVVGAGSVVGRACASMLAAEGGEILVLDGDEGLAADVCTTIDAAGGTATPQRAGPFHEDDARAVAETCAARWGRLDILVYCSALMDYWDESDDSLANWESVLRTTLLGPVVYTNALLPLMRESRAGSIVYLGSIDGIRGNPRYPAYSVAKGGLIPLTHVMAHSCAPVRVNCAATAAILQIGPNDPPPRHSLVEALASTPQPALGLTPLARYARPEDVASVVLFFASDDSAYVTGSVLPVDGGRSAITPGTGERPLGSVSER